MASSKYGLALVVSLALVAACTIAPAPSYRVALIEPESFRVPVGALANDFAWIGPHRVAIASSDGRASVVIVDLTTGEGVELELPRRRACVVETIGAMQLLPSGELGFSLICRVDTPEQPIVSEFLAVDLASLSSRLLADVPRPAVDAAWTSDLSRTVYVGARSLCETLYELDGVDRPMEVVVEVEGRQVPLGEDLEAADDACTAHGNAAYPDFGPGDGQLAVFAAASRGISGQARLDQRWSIVLVDDGGAQTTVLDGVRYPAGLQWLTEDRLIFAGRVSGRWGLWLISADGTDLTLIAETVDFHFSVAADGSGVLAANAAYPDGLEDSELALLWFEGVGN